VKPDILFGLEDDGILEKSKTGLYWYRNTKDTFVEMSHNVPVS
jgi:hypothetical protein